MSDTLPVTVWITRRVKPGCETAFENALHEFVQRSLTYPGQFGVHVVRPTPASGSRDYRVVRKFANRSAMNAFWASEDYAAWTRRTRELTEGEPRFEELCGLESWFTPESAPLRPFPKWKMALITFTGVYPLTSFLPRAFSRLLPGWHPLLLNVFVTGTIVLLLSWLVMPLLTRLLHRWLHA